MLFLESLEYRLLSLDTTYDTIRYETPSTGVARIVLARAEQRNAQNLAMTYELDAAFKRAAADTEIRVIILAADGPHFSSGHDLRDRSTPEDYAQITNWGAFEHPEPKVGRPSKKRSISVCVGAGVISLNPPLPKPKVKRSLADLCWPGCAT